MPAVMSLLGDGGHPAVPFGCIGTTLMMLWTAPTLRPCRGRYCRPCDAVHGHPNSYAFAALHMSAHGT
jgi:hypothetical protein